MQNTVENVAAIANPFLFLQPYDLNAKHKLEGRDNETVTLLALLEWKDIMVVFGKSGVGKTSFINHALSFGIERVSWIPVRVTRLLDINQSLCANIHHAITAESADQIHDQDTGRHSVTDQEPLLEEGEDGNNTADCTVGLVRKLYCKWNRPVYLIIDQLEELFLIGNKQEQEIFLETLQKLVDKTDIQKKIILVLREEHLGYIQDIERILRGVFQDALAVKEINNKENEKILSSLLIPHADDEVLSEALEEFNFKILPYKQLILRQCVNDGKFNAQKLQILLFLLWERLSGMDSNDRLNATVYAVCNAADPLLNYLDATINKELSQNARLLKAPYWFMLRNSISAANTKMLVSLSESYLQLLKALEQTGQAHKKYQITKEKLKEWYDALAENKIMEKIPVPQDEAADDHYYQLKHDTVIPAIRKLDPDLQLRFPMQAEPEDTLQNPYVGLRQYGFESDKSSTLSLSLRKESKKKTPKLYGRSDIINEFKKYLTVDGNNCLVIVGDSGTGKSSLVKGGLLAAMRAAGYITEVKQPGPDLSSFRREIESFISGAEDMAQPKQCLYIDQFEECYTYRKTTTEEQGNFDEFLQYLSNAIENLANNFKLVVSIRHDYAHEFDRKISQWRKFKKLLRYPNEEEVFDIIVGPAHDNGVHFKPANLPEIIAADAMNTSYFLPLLSFTMQTLYKTDVLDKYYDIRSPEWPCLTEESYKKIGGIVKCLQKQFTKRHDAVKAPELFRQLMPRMIVIKDTIPKSQVLPVEKINFREPGKADRSIDMLGEFVPEFLRQRTVIVDGVAQECFEPLHDSLLIYCDEIRSLINPNSKENDQTRLQIDFQPLVELAQKEWSGTPDTGKPEFLACWYKNLELLIDFVQEPGNESKNWLFRDEMELLDEFEQYSVEIKDAEKKLLKVRIQEIEVQRSEEQLRNRTLEVDMKLMEAQAEEVKLSEQKLKAELKAQAERAKRKRMSRFLILAAFLATSMGVIASILADANIKQAQAAKELRSYSDSLAENAILLTATVRERDSTNNALKEASDSLEISNLKYIEAANRLRLSQALLKTELTKSVAYADSLSITTDSLTSVIRWRDSVVLANQESEKEKELNDKIESYNTIAHRQSVSPTLSYRLAQASLDLRAENNYASYIKKVLEANPAYFESIIQNNIRYSRVSRDGSKVLTVEENPKVFGQSIIKLWNIDESQCGASDTLNTKIIGGDISRDNNKILLVEETGIRILDNKATQLRNFKSRGNLQFAQFAETDGRFFCITSTEILIFSEDGYQTNNIPFVNRGNVNSARLWKNKLTIITPLGISYMDINTEKQLSTKNAQSFLVSTGGGILSMDPMPPGTGNIVFYNAEMKKVWEREIPNGNFTVITKFANSPDGKYGIIRFNELRNTFTGRLAQQTRKNESILYFVNLSDGHLTPVFDTVVINKFTLSDNADFVFEYSTASINIYRYNIRIGDYYTFTHLGKISDNTRFNNLYLAGRNRDLLISHDDNGQFKVWRYGRARYLNMAGQLWQFPKAELEKITGIK